MDDAPPHVLRTMTFNIRHGRALDGKNRWYKRREGVFEVIRSRSPHVAGLQEVDPFQLEELLDAFPTFGAIAHHRYGGPLSKVTGAYAPILFDGDRLEPGQSGDFWLSPQPDGKRVRAWDAAVSRVCTWAVFRDRETGARFAALNSHFDQRGVIARRHSAEIVIDRLAELEHLPRIFTADLNANEASEPLKLLLDSGMRDSFRVVQPDAAPAFTFHRFQGMKAKGRLGKIDFILVDERWDVRAAEIVRDEVGGRFPSDHFALTATLALS